MPINNWMDIQIVLISIQLNITQNLKDANY